jgi:hypothetical protein
VSLDVLDSNGNYRNIGSATSDANGFYSLAWKPDITGKFTVYANFAGTKAYYGASAVAAFVVDEAAPGAPIEPEQPTDPIGPIEPEEPTEVPTEPEEPTEVPTEPEQPTEPEPEAPFLTTEVAIIIAVAVIAVAAIAAYWVLRRRK